MNKSAFLDKINEVSSLLKSSEICNKQIAKLELLYQKFEQKEFVISVFGQFKRGKSSFINNMLGEDILPVGIVPVTSVVTQIKYGEKCAIVSFPDGSRKIDFEELYNYINEQHNPDNVKKVTSVQIFYPCEILKSGLTIVDTPGVGSMHKHNSDAAYSFVKDSDAVIFMLSVDSPINEIERDFLIAIKEYASKIYFAVNKIDIVTADELKEYINYCQRLLCSIMDTDTIKLYPVCAKDKKDSGSQKLVKGILTDIDVFGDEILLNSVRIKSKDIIKEALGQIELYVSGLSMPINKLEETSGALAQKLLILEDMAKDTTYIINQRTDMLIENIRAVFENEGQKISAEVLAEINKAYEEEPLLNPKLLDEKLRNVLESLLTQRLVEINDKGISMLKSGYEDTTRVFEENLGKIHSYLSDSIKELFNVEYCFNEDRYTLSEAEDFYINVNSGAPSFFFDNNSFVRFLPKGKANKIILERVLEGANSDVSTNITNMLSNYAYKIRESKRTFNSRFTDKAKELKSGFETFIEKTITERKKAGDQYGDKIAGLQGICISLKQYSEEFSQGE